MHKIVLAYSMSSFFFGLFGVNWDSVDSKIANEYPNVKFISSTDLIRDYQATASAAAFVADVRESDEFRVSHLLAARNLPTAEQIAEAVSNKSTPIVVYCSVGYRSAAVAHSLQEMGYSNVRNLRHSIFEWAQQGYPMENAQGPTSKVHPYNRAWGSLVDSDLHAYQPE